MHLRSINPFTGEAINEYNEFSFEEVGDAIQLSTKNFSLWRKTTIAYRIDLLKVLADHLRNEVEALAFIITMEMGKPIAQSRAEVAKCAVLCDYYINHAETFLQPIPVAVEQGKAFVSMQPLGPLLAIMPWNFPFWQVFRFAVPALMAGNTVLLKHASNVPACALAIERMFAEAGFPLGVFKTLC
jgi:succinate-semialdehyde dehydrogenase / glutarate-semialdehyde dehydrogenase